MNPQAQSKDPHTLLSTPSGSRSSPCTAVRRQNEIGKGTSSTRATSASKEEWVCPSCQAFGVIVAVGVIVFLLYRAGYLRHPEEKAS
jgi:hypothetical protein